jgi:hypothetical protein
MYILKRLQIFQLLQLSQFWKEDTTAFIGLSYSCSWLCNHSKLKIKLKNQLVFCVDYSVFVIWTLSLKLTGPHTRANAYNSAF